MFKSLSKGLQVYLLEKKEVPRYLIGTVVSVSEPRFQPQVGQYQMNERLIDLTIKVDGDTKTYSVGENQSVAYSRDTTLACSVETISNEVNAIMSNSKECLANVEKYKATISECEKIIKQINPAFAQTVEQEKKLVNLESQVKGIGQDMKGISQDVKELSNIVKQLLKNK